MSREEYSKCRVKRVGITQNVAEDAHSEQARIREYTPTTSGPENPA
jgi:hypothetical protein